MIVLRIGGGLRLLRMANDLALEDGREFSELSEQAQARYIEIAKCLLAQKPEAKENHGNG